MNFLGSPDNGSTAGTDILSGTGTTFAGTLQAWNLGADKAETALPKGFHEGFTFRGKFGDMPSVFTALFHGQGPGCFRHALELLVVVQTGTGSVLNPILKVFSGEPFHGSGWNRFLQRGGSDIQRKG